MTNAQLDAFRKIAKTMRGPNQDWKWIGPHMSQRMFSITLLSAPNSTRPSMAELRGQELTDSAAVSWSTVSAEGCGVEKTTRGRRVTNTSAPTSGIECASTTVQSPAARRASRLRAA